MEKDCKQELIEKIKTIDEMALRIKKLEELNEQALETILHQSRHIRYLEDMNKAKRI